MTWINHALVTRIEQTLSWHWVHYAARVREVDPSAPNSTATTLMESGSGLASFAGVGIPMTRAGALGLGCAVTPTEVQKVEEFFFSRGDDCRLEVCPYADPTLLGSLTDRGYIVRSFSNVYVRRLYAWDAEEPPLPASVTIERVTRENGLADLYEKTLRRGFIGDGPAPAFFNTGIWEASLSLPGGSAYLARVDGVAAGAGLCDLFRGVAMLFGTAVIQELRCLGVQAALIAKRLANAAAGDGGCDIAVIQSRPGTVSDRNIVRAGFTLAYTRPLLVKTRPVQAPNNGA